MSIIENPISITLARDESVTVPSGETWRLEVAGPNRFKVNGEEIFETVTTGATYARLVFTGGDVLENGGGNTTGIHLGGFKL